MPTEPRLTVSFTRKDRAGKVREMPRLVIVNDYVCEEVDGCTCGANYEVGGHESGCGLEPIGKVDLRHHDAEVAAKALRDARQVITQYLATAEKWRYDRVVWAFAVMLGEIPEDTPEPMSPADARAVADRIVREAGTDATT